MYGIFNREGSNKVMNNKNNLYNQYRKKRTDTNILFGYAPDRYIKKNFRRYNQKHFEKFLTFYYSVKVTKNEQQR